jgi:hypothetical protein
MNYNKNRIPYNKIKGKFGDNGSGDRTNTGDRSNFVIPYDANISEE